MNPKPLKRYKIPGYPTRLEIMADPSLLEKHCPAEWLKKAEMAGMVALFLAANLYLDAKEEKQSPKPKSAVVAPLFKHGEGRGITGCIVVGPPVFLSEEEALQVIKEEISNAGIKITDKNRDFREIAVTERSKERLHLGPPRKHVLNVDLISTNSLVAIEYISKGDYRVLGGLTSQDTVQEYDLPEVVENLGNEIKSQGRGFYFGTFYDPLISTNRRLDEKEMSRVKEAREKSLDELRRVNSEIVKKQKDQAYEESKRLLRLQVKDFIDWLKAQGAI